MRICIRTLGLTLTLLLLAGCAALQSLTEPPPTPTPAVPALPAPMPEDPYGLDFPPVPVWDFYREWLENPAAAHHKYYGRTITLAYARGLVPYLRNREFSQDGLFFAALQAPKGGPDAAQIQAEIARDFKSSLGHNNPIEAGWGPWIPSYHRPLSGRDFQLRCGDSFHNLWGIMTAFFVIEQGGEPSYGPLTFDVDPKSEPRWLQALGKEIRPLSIAPPMLRIHAEKWTERVYVVHGRVLGHGVGWMPYGRPLGRTDRWWDSDLERIFQRAYLYVEMDQCAFEIMDISATEMDAWFDADRERLSDPEAAPYRPITRDDHVVPVARPLNDEVWSRIQEHAFSSYDAEINIVGRSGDNYVLQRGRGHFMLAPITDFTKPRSDAPPLPMFEDAEIDGCSICARILPRLATLDRLRRNWLFIEEGACVFLGQDWPECIPAVKAEWMRDPENRREWLAAGGD